MDYKKLTPEFVNDKLVYDKSKIWNPSILEMNGFKIGETVYHVNKEKQYLTEFKIVVEQIYTAFNYEDNGFKQYYNPIERVVLKPTNGTWTSGNDYAAVWFKNAIEFPFEFIVKKSNELEAMRKKVTHCTFVEADKLWAALSF